LAKEFSERSERRKPGDGRCRERSERQRTAPGGTRRTMAKRASVASDFGHRMRITDVDSPYLALKLGESMWSRNLREHLTYPAS
jgi:hypothetical protein